MQKSSVNKVILVGHIGNKPEGRYTPAGTSTASFSLATNESWIDSENEKQERTEWHRVVCFNRLGEIAGEYVRKGTKLYVEGSLRTRKWQDQQGQDKYTTEIVASDIQLLDSKGGAQMDQNTSFTPSSSKPTPKKSAQPQQVSQEAFDELDDDIPF